MRTVHTGETLWKIQNGKIREQTIKKSSVGKEKKAKKERKLGLEIQFSLTDISLHF